MSERLRLIKRCLLNMLSLPFVACASALTVISTLVGGLILVMVTVVRFLTDASHD